MPVPPCFGRAQTSEHAVCNDAAFDFRMSCCLPTACTLPLRGGLSACPAGSSKQYLYTAPFDQSQSWVVAQQNYYRSGAMAGDSYSPSANPFDKELLSIRS
jgi:hypothetical protein